MTAKFDFMQEKLQGGCGTIVDPMKVKHPSHFTGNPKDCIFLEYLFIALVYLVSCSLHGDLATIFVLDDCFDVQLLGVWNKAGCPGIKRPVLGLNPLLLGFAEKDGCRPVLGHLGVAAHVDT